MCSAARKATAPRSRDEVTLQECADGEGIEAERRLAHVALTRAQRALTLHWTVGAASQFLTEAGSLGRRAHPPLMSVLDLLGTIEALDDRDRAPLLTLAGIENGSRRLARLHTVDAGSARHVVARRPARASESAEGWNAGSVECSGVPDRRRADFARAIGSTRVVASARF
jgi:hypothetical protein